jgi:hypothetical protein
MAIKNTSITRNFPYFSGLVHPKVTPLNTQLTTGGGVVTLTAAQLLGGLLTIDCDDAQTLTLPTATLINAALSGVEVGTAIDFDVINFGDTTLTIAVGTGITAKAISGVSAVLTIVANASKRFRLVCTGVQDDNGNGSHTYDLYGFGSVAAATA